MAAWRRLATVVLSWTEVEPPSVAKRMPPPAPAIQRLVPSVLIAERGLFPVAASVKPVVVSTFPFASRRPMTRGVAAEVVPARPLVGIGASYPVSNTNLPSDDRVMSPSEVAVPLATRR